MTIHEYYIAMELKFSKPLSCVYTPAEKSTEFQLIKHSSEYPFIVLPTLGEII